MATKTVRGCFQNLQEQLKIGRRIKLGLGLDDYFRMSPGEILIMMARAGVGKTAWACNLINALVEQGCRVLFFSMEMTGESILLRLASLYYAVPQGTIKDWAKEEPEQLDEFFSVYRDLTVDDTNALTPKDINIRTRTADPDVVIVDYLQYIRGWGQGAYEKATNAVIGLKAMAKSQGVPVIALSQTSRAGGDGTVPINMDMARDTGAIEETADYLLGMWRDRDEVDKRHCSLLKNRHGRLCHFVYFYNAPLMRFNYRGNGGY